MRGGLGLLRRLCMIGHHLTLYLHWAVSRWLRSLHTLVLTDVHDLIEVWDGSSPVETSYHSAIFMDVVLRQLIPYLMCKQDPI